MLLLHELLICLQVRATSFGHPMLFVRYLAVKWYRAILFLKYFLISGISRRHMYPSCLHLCFTMQKIMTAEIIDAGQLSIIWTSLQLLRAETPTAFYIEWMSWQQALLV